MPATTPQVQGTQAAVDPMMRFRGLFSLPTFLTRALAARGANRHEVERSELAILGGSANPRANGRLLLGG